MLRLKPGNTTTPDGFTYKFPQTGHIIYAISRDDWFVKIAKYAEDNQFPCPTVEEAEDQLCRRLSGEWCSGGNEASFINTRFSLDDFLRGTSVLAKFVLNGEVVAPETAEERARICSQCFANVTVPGCSACSGMANAIAGAKGAQKTKYDHLLRACGVCHCSNEAQVWLPAKFLKSGVTEKMMEQYKQIPDACWKRDALLALEAD